MIGVLSAALLILTIFAVLFAANSPIEKPLESAAVIFVFAGSAEYKSRAAKAAELFRAHCADKIVLTDDAAQGGWSASDRRNLFYWESARRELIKNGVPPENIEVLPQPVFGTRDEAVLLVETVKARGWQSVLLVTSDFHTRRAYETVRRICEHQNLNLQIGIAAAENRSSTALDKIRRRGEETIKSIYYRLFY